MIRFHQVAFGYQQKTFIEACDIMLPAGGITSVIGPNGCGKSTLLKLAAGLLKPDAGRITWQGQDLRCFSRKELARQWAFLQQGHQKPEMSVEELVLCGRYPHKGFLQAADEKDLQLREWAITAAKCGAYRHKSCQELSGGELQRAFIAMTLAQDCSYIFLDEPTTYLDIGVGYEMMETIAALNRKLGKTIIMILHDLAMALQYSDRLILMDKGCIVFDGGPEEIAETDIIGKTFSVELKSFYEENRFFYCCQGIKRG